MNFTSLVYDKIFPLLKPYGYYVLEKNESMIEFSNALVRVRFSYDNRENVVLLFLGYKFDNSRFSYILFHYADEYLMRLGLTTPIILNDDSVSSQINIQRRKLEASEALLLGNEDFYLHIKAIEEQEIKEYNSRMK